MYTVCSMVYGLRGLVWDGQRRETKQDVEHNSRMCGRSSQTAGCIVFLWTRPSNSRGSIDGATKQRTTPSLAYSNRIRSLATTSHAECDGFSFPIRNLDRQTCPNIKRTCTPILALFRILKTPHALFIRRLAKLDRRLTSLILGANKSLKMDRNRIPRSHVPMQGHGVCRRSMKRGWHVVMC